MEIHSNQPKGGGSDGLEVGAMVSSAMRVGWDVIISFGPSKRATKNIEKKHVVAFDGHHTIFYTQQPTKNTRVQWRRDRTG
jgi:hypothetical protein